MNRDLLSVSFRTAVRANDAFDLFLKAETLPDILKSYHNICDQLCLKPDVFRSFYPKLNAKLKNWKSKEVFEKFDSRAKHDCYADGEACRNTKVLVIGAGPCGLRTAIEAQLLGAKVVVIEKRNYMSRNNVLRLWPFVIEDLRILGAKGFVRQFCIGSIDHISIRQLQCLLLKISLLLGVEVHTEVSFQQLIEPNSEEKTGWRAKLDPVDHVVSKYDFDVIVGADGGRSSFSKDFGQKQLRSKRAIAITVNLVNNRTDAERKVPEISGISYIYNQRFFKKLGTVLGIYLENIIYYKDNTHYFVMTPTKSSLIAKGVIKEDLVGDALLNPNNVNQEALQSYAKEAIEFSTKYQLRNLEFAVNHYGQPDIAMFDFSTMYVAESSSKVAVRGGYKLLKLLVGDGLLQPFWPTGSGCARGFLSSFDAAWAIKTWSSGVSPLEVLAERESIFKLLGQTTSDNLNKNVKAFTLDPSTRYRNLNKALVSHHQVLGLYDSDDSKAEVHSNDSKSRYENLKCKSVDTGLVLPSAKSPLIRNDSLVWNRCQSFPSFGNPNFPKTDNLSNLVSKFQSFASGNLNRNSWKPSFDTITSTPVSKYPDKDKSSTSSNIFRPNARRGISTVLPPTVDNSILPKYSRSLEQHRISACRRIRENYSQMEVTSDEGNEPVIAVKRQNSFVLSARNTFKRFRRSNSKRMDKLEPDLKETGQDIGLYPKEPLNRVKRIVDRWPDNNSKQSSFRSPGKYLSRKLAFKRLRDKYEFGNLESESLGENQPRAMNSDNRERRVFNGVANFVSNIFSKREE